MTRLTVPVQLSPHLYIVYSEFPHCDSGNVYLIRGQHPTLIDCGSQRAVPYIVRNLQQLGVGIDDIEQVIGTHGDYDHVQGYAELNRQNPRLRLLLHRDDWPIVQGNDSYRNASYVYGHPFLPLMPEQCFPLDIGEITAGDTSLTVIHAPGHTEGSVCLLGRIDGHVVLFAGDAIGGSMRSLDGAVVSIWTQALSTWKHSLETLAVLDFEWVLTGHEPAATLPISRAQFDRMVSSFGKMMNPWFSLSPDEDEALPEGAAIES